MATLNEIINEIQLKLAGFTMRQERTTHLTVACDSSELILYVNSTDNISKGLIEIDNELMWVDAFDKTSKTLSIAPYGRGYFGTTPVAHDASSKITIAPAYPSSSIKNAVNDIINSLTGTLYGIQSETFSSNPAITTYEVPANAKDVIAVSYQDIGPTKEWFPVRRYRVDKTANQSAFSSKISISIYDGIPSSSDIQVVYTVDPQTFESEDDDFESTTNLPISCKDVIIFGAIYNLISFVDIGRSSFSSAEADLQSSKIQFGSGSSSAKYIYALYQQRLQEEVAKLRDAYPVRVHYTR